MQMVLTASHGRNSPSFQPQKVSRTSLEISVTNRAPLEASIGSPWLNIWEMSPEVASPDGNTRVILAGSPSPGFDMIRELFVDVGGQKVPATILQGGMLAFIAPQRPPGHIHIMVTNSFGHVVSSSTVLKVQYPRRASCSDALQPREEKRRGLSAVWAAALPEHPENNNNSVHQVDLVSNFVSTKTEPSNGHIGAAPSLTSAKRRSDAGGMMDCPYLQEPGTY
jgi:hypothetical protein